MQAIVTANEHSTPVARPCNLFVYGIFLSSFNVEMVTQRVVDSSAAVLRGFSRRQAGGLYYAEVDPVSSISGRVLFDIQDDELQEFDRIEGVSHGLYIRRKVEVELVHSGEPVWAFVYVGGRIAKRGVYGRFDY